jgi:hypothetical protein
VINPNSVSEQKQAIEEFKKRIKQSEESVEALQIKEIEEPKTVEVAVVEPQIATIVPHEPPIKEISIPTPILEIVEEKAPVRVVEPEPVVEPKIERVVEPEPVVVPKVEPVVEPEPVVVPDAEPVVEIEPVVVPKVEPVVEPEPEIDIESFLEEEIEVAKPLLDDDFDFLTDEEPTSLVAPTAPARG